ncbi:galactokinase [Aquiluna sp.]|nr:galactokinase [Aquiluna sp.]MDA8927482.1 galactokinase [Aquiluna sp.]
MNLASQTAEGFKAIFGCDPQGVWSAPGRANLIGEHTDYNNGFVLPFGIDKRTYAAIAKRADRNIRVATSFSQGIVEIELTDNKPEDLDWALYPLGVAWVMRAGLETGFDLYLDSDVPVGAGLSSSAAVECSVALALDNIWELGHTRQELALLGQRAENEVVGAPTGIMDQTASMLAAQDSAVLIDCKSLDTELIELGFGAKGLIIAVIDTQVSHRHSDGGYKSRRDACELGAAIMNVESLRELSEADLPKAQELMDDVTFRRVRHIVTENSRVIATVAALKSSELEKLGQLFEESHASMRDDFEISIPELDLAVETALNAGAIASRMTGGGFGGAAIALIDSSKLSELGDAVAKAFDSAGFSPARVFAVSASAGAKREI